MQASIGKYIQNVSKAMRGSYINGESTKAWDREKMYSKIQN